MRSFRLIWIGFAALGCSSTPSPSGAVSKDAASTDTYFVVPDVEDTAISPDPDVEDAAPPDTAVEDPGPAPDLGPPDVCAGLADDSVCDLDADPCTIERCLSEVCVATEQKETCEAKALEQPCWTFTCSKKTGCVPTIFVEGASCDDANPCTVNDACHELDIKACVGTPVPIDDGNPCTDDACKGGNVSHQPVDGAPCVLAGAPGLCVLGKCVTDGCTPVDGGWSAWAWGACSEPCDGGTRSGTRTCTAPKASCGGKDCIGAAVTTEPCNLQPCQAGGSVSECPAGLPFAKNSGCLVPEATSGFAKTVDTGLVADSYGVKLVRGPPHTVAALYKQQEWFERLDDDGKVLLAAVSLPVKNPSVAPAALGEPGFPAFYGPALGFDGSSFGIGRSGNGTGAAYLYTVDLNGALVAGPLKLAPPGVTGGSDHGPALEWTGTHWLLGWKADDGEEIIVIARINPDATLDDGWGTGGFLTIDGGGWHPEIAVSGDGSLAAVVWGETQFGFALIDVDGGTVVTQTAGMCSGGSIGTNGDGHDVIWNDALGEFGVLASGQGENGNCYSTNTSVTATLLRVSTAGEWIGAPVPLFCGYAIGAGMRGGIEAYPDGRYAIAMARYHTKPYCIEPFPNGTQGVASFDMLTIDAALGTVPLRRTYEKIPSPYTQTDIVWSGGRMVAMTPSGITSKNAGYAFED